MKREILSLTITEESLDIVIKKNIYLSSKY